MGRKSQVHEPVGKYVDQNDSIHSIYGSNSQRQIQTLEIKHLSKLHAMHVCQQLHSSNELQTTKKQLYSTCMIDSIPNNMHTIIYSLQRFKQRCMENTTGGLDSIAYYDTISCCSNHRFHRRCSLSPVHRSALADETRSLRTL
jgi:hypothetical protein